MNRLLQRYQVRSDPLRSERRAELVMLGAGLLMILFLVWGAFRALVPGSSQPVMPTAESLQVSTLAGNGLATVEDREVIRARPLFWASRAPLADQEKLAQAETPTEAAGNQRAASLKGVKLAGVFGMGESGGVILLNKGKKQRLMVGQTLEGWTLDSVAPTEVTLRNAGSEAVLALERGKPVESLAGQYSEAPAEPASKAGRKSKAGGGKAGAGEQGKVDKQRQGAAKQQTRPDGLILGGGQRNK